MEAEKELEKTINDLSYFYSLSFKKNIYINFKSINSLVEYRDKLLDNRFKLVNKLNVIRKDLCNVNDKIVLLYNDLCYHEILLNK